MGAIPKPPVPLKVIAVEPPAEVAAEVIPEPPKLYCGCCGKEVQSSEFPKCAECVKADAPIPRPLKPDPQDDPTGEKFVAWVKADMVWKQHPRREL